MTLRLITRPAQTEVSQMVRELQAADGAWVPIENDHSLVISPQARSYWNHKLGKINLRIEIAQDDETRSYFGRLICQ